MDNATRSVKAKKTNVGIILENDQYQNGQRFALIVKEFVNFIDNRSQFDSPTFLLELLKILGQLYLKGYDLPILEEIDSDDLNLPTEEDVQLLNKSLVEYLGEFNEYYSIFDPIEIDEDDPYVSELSESISDLYYNLKMPYILWSHNDNIKKQLAIIDWNDGWELSWGSQVLDIMRVIHSHIEEFNIKIDP